jgi:stringent starvation protein B
MTPSKPYLLRALFEWILDNDLTPHLIVDAHADGVVVPAQAVQDGRVVLNIAPSATRDLLMENDMVSFQARFSGVSQELWIPTDAVLAIYARENGQGMMFADGADDGDPEDAPDGDGSGPADGPGKKTGGPKLRVIK